ncbi:MAG: hypothetical protein GXP49_00550, partial [Deltaproteobacteria bacterium]|nr:hypothetical protein [Deltaproteobacteria bacterium]
MADTKGLPKKERKRARRTARRELSKLYNGLTEKQRKRYRKWEKKGIKAFLA